MLLFIIIPCIIGIAGAAAVTTAAFEDDNEEIESLKVSEGGNLTISIQIESSETEPQVWVTQIKSSSSDVMIAQLICRHDGECSRQCWRSGSLLLFDGETVTLILTNFTYSEAGLYKACKLSSTPQESKIYNISVNRKDYNTESPLSTKSPERSASVMTSTPVTGAICVTAVVVLVIAAIGVALYRRTRQTSLHLKGLTSEEVSLDDDADLTSISCLNGDMNEEE